MKAFSYLILFSLSLTFLTLTGCGDDDGGTPPLETVKDRFSGTYAVQSVMFESEDRTDSYSNFNLTVTASGVDIPSGNYSTTTVEELDPWPSSGTWTFTNPESITNPDAQSFQVTRGDGVVIDVDLSDTQMTLEFTYDPDQHASDDNKVKSVAGSWTFVLTPQ